MYKLVRQEDNTAKIFARRDKSASQNLDDVGKDEMMDDKWKPATFEECGMSLPTSPNFNDAVKSLRDNGWEVVCYPWLPDNTKPGDCALCRRCHYDG